MMRSRGHHDLSRDPRRRGTVAVPIRIIELCPEFLSPALETHRMSRDLVDLHAVEGCDDRIGRRELGHRVVVRRVPAGELTWVARLTSVRRGVTVGGLLNRPAGHITLGKKAGSVAEKTVREDAANGEGQYQDGERLPHVRRSGRLYADQL